MSIGTVGTPQTSVITQQPVADGTEVYSHDVLANPNIDGQARALRAMELRDNSAAAQGNIGIGASQQINDFGEKIALMMAMQSAPSADGEKMRALLGGEPQYQAPKSLDGLMSLMAMGNVKFGIAAGTPPAPENAKFLDTLNADGIEFKDASVEEKKARIEKAAMNNNIKVQDIYPQELMKEGNIEHLSLEQALLLTGDPVTKKAVSEKKSIDVDSYRMGDNYSPDAFRTYMMQFSGEKQKEVLRETLNELFINVAGDNKALDNTQEQTRDWLTGNAYTEDEKSKAQKKIDHIMADFEKNGDFNGVIGKIFDHEANDKHIEKGPDGKDNKVPNSTYTKAKMKENLF